MGWIPTINPYGDPIWKMSFQPLKIWLVFDVLFRFFRVLCGGFQQNGGTPIAGWFIMEIPLKSH
jgi:hypothetical protein